MCGVSSSPVTRPTNTKLFLIRSASREGDSGRRAINADAPGADIEALCRPDAGARALLVKAAEQMALSARACHRVMKVARTIADLDNADSIARVHAAGALNYRFRPPGATTQKSGVGGLVA